jgi:ATP-binding cassette, subfamily B (MDR/TAP), member 1
MRLEYMRAVLHQPVSALDALPSGRISAIVTNTANNMQLGIGEKLGAFVTAAALLASALAIAYSHHWKLSLVTSSGLFLIAGAYAFTMPYTVRIMKTVEASEIYAGGVAGEAFFGVRMVAACGAEEINARRYDKWVRESRDRGDRLCKYQAIQQGTIYFTTYG